MYVEFDLNVNIYLLILSARIGTERKLFERRILYNKISVTCGEKKKCVNSYDPQPLLRLVFLQGSCKGLKKR